MGHDAPKSYYLAIHTIFLAAPTAVLAVMGDDGTVSLYKPSSDGVVMATAALVDGVWVTAEWGVIGRDKTIKQIRAEDDHYYLSRMRSDRLGQCVACARKAEFVAGKRTHGHRHWCAKCHHEDIEWWRNK